MLNVTSVQVALINQRTLPPAFLTFSSTKLTISLFIYSIGIAGIMTPDRSITIAGFSRYNWFIDDQAAQTDPSLLRKVQPVSSIVIFTVLGNCDAISRDFLAERNQ